jgi:hypothetical protein
MMPAAIEVAHAVASLISVAGSRAAFSLSRLGG